MAVIDSRPISPLQWERVGAAFLLVVIGCRIELAGGVRLGDITALALLPLTWPQIRHSKTFAYLSILTTVSLLFGALLVLNTGDNPLHPAQLRESFLALCAAGIAIPAAALWARRVLSTPIVLASLATGLLIDGLLSFGSSTNPWKFSIGIPVTLIVLALTMERSRWLQLCAAVAMAFTFMLSDARSSFGMALATGVIVVLFGAGPQKHKIKSFFSSAWIRIVLLAAVAWGAYSLVIGASEAGWLGEAAQLRTQAQFVNSDGILAARPEAAATWALFQLRPWGFGPGVGLSYNDLVSAKNALAMTSYDLANNGYVSSFMFGNAIELHSVIGDLWAAFGPFGLLFVLSGLVLALRGIISSWRLGWLSAVSIFLFIVFFWNALFGPFSPMVVMIGMLLFLAIQKPADA